MADEKRKKVIMRIKNRNNKIMIWIKIKIIIDD
jgi:hypothetical protein